MLTKFLLIVLFGLAFIGLWTLVESRAARAYAHLEASGLHDTPKGRLLNRIRGRHSHQDQPPIHKPTDQT